MADIWTNQAGNSWCPQMHFVVSLAAGTDGYDDLNWYADYVAHGTPAYTNGIARTWNINIDGQTRSGTININGVSNTVRLASGTIRVSKQHAHRNIRVECSINLDVTWAGSYIAWGTASGTHPIGAKTSYAISYNANGGSGAPGKQTKWYGENLALSGTKPTRTGHNFAGWATSASGGVAYQPGSTYSGNAALTLYAKWTPHTYTVSYNANGGSGAPGNQTKTYGVNLTLSGTKPTRNLYNFKGWGTSSSSTTASYQPGGTYSSNSAIALYAIWELAWLEPRITNLQATRCDSAGTLSEEGTYAKVTFNWATDRTISSIKIVCNSVTTNASGSGTSGSVSVVVGANALNTESQYTVRVTVTDAVGEAFRETVVAPMDYIMDIAPNGSVAFGKPANPSKKCIEFSKPVFANAPLNGLYDLGYHANGARYKILAKADLPNLDLGNSGGIRVTGFLGDYTANQGVIDVFVPVRGASSTTVSVNILTPGVFNDRASLMVILGNDDYVYLIIRANSYYYYNLRLEGVGFSVINSDWSATRIQGTVLLDSNQRKTDEFGGYPAKLEYVNGYYGFALPDKTRTDWIRTTRNGLIPYRSGGASALGTESWPFNNVYTNNMYINNSRIVDHVVASGTSGVWRYIKWNNGAAECWARELSVANSNGYFAISSYNYPFTIYDASAVVSLKDYTHTGNTTHNMSFMDRNNTKVDVKIASDTGDISDLGSKKIDVHVKGRWK